MLSLVNSSDPSRSSSRVSGFRADERDSDQLPLREEDPVVRFGEARASNFSIRDHVFALRNKSIIKSWPFPSQLLQLCLKHGIRDLLPPFEPPNSVRAHCLISSVSEAEKLIVSSSNLGETALLLNGEPSSTPTHHLCLPSNQNNLLTCSTIQAEEASTTSATSDIMASKVCPVCKAFSSTSNTTLNAHMDQCLSMESEAALAADKMAKLKVKPRKKRLMEDIYATAPSCTLEDLDRRNGSTWAVDLTAVALSAEANSEPKKTKLLQLEPRDEKTEGAVYVDSNGIKLRILSKFNDADPQVLSREELEPRRSIKSARDGKIAFLKEKKHFTSAYSKKMKLKMRNKKLSSLKLFKIEAQAEPKAVLHHEESHVEDEGPVPLSGEAEQSLNCGSVTLKNWPSSKRSDLLKKVGRKNLHKIMERPKQDNEIEMPETTRSASDTPSASKSHFGKLSKLLESITADLPSETVQNKEIQEEIYMGRKQKSHASTETNGGSADQSCLVPPKTKRVSTLGGSSSGTVKFRKHRSLLAWTDRRIGELSSDGDLRRHRSVEAIVSGQGEEVANQRTDPGGSHYHDTQTRISEMQVDRNADEGTLEDADASCVIPDKTNLLMPIQENEMPMAQAPLEEEAAPDKLENGQESSACLTSNGDLRIDIPREKNSAIAMDSLAPNQETKLVSCREPSISPASSASTISPASPNHHYFKSSLLSTTQEKSIFPLLPFMEAREGIAAERNQQVDLEYSAVKKKPQHPSDSHPCCCSWQSLMAVNMPPTKPKPLPNLHIRPSISSFYSYPNSKTDAANTPSLESPTESILTRACSDVGSPSPSSGTPTPTHSSSNSILRLMGKDLMVVHNEESVQLPKVHSPATDSNSNAQASPSPLGFALPVRNQSPSMADPQARNCSPAFHRSNLNRKAYTTAKEVIIIDDSDDVFAPRDPSSRAMFQRPFSYFPPHSHLLADDNGGRLSNPAGQGSSVTAPRLPRPFAFQSPSATHLNSPFCYPQSLR